MIFGRYHLLFYLYASENYPFHNFLISFISDIDVQETININENFEIMGFPIPAFSIFSLFSFLSYDSITKLQK